MSSPWWGLRSFEASAYGAEHVVHHFNIQGLFDPELAAQVFGFCFRDR